MLKKIQTARQIHVVGLSGTEGAAIALWLAKHKIPFIGHDFSPAKRFEKSFAAAHLGLSLAQRTRKLEQLLTLPNPINFQENYLSGIEKADLIFVSQNWEAYAPNSPLLKIYKKNPELFATITQLYFALFPGKILAVTGTNGKSTTTKLIAEIMLASRHKSWFTGNDRRNVQILDQQDKWQKQDWLVIEVSNRQLKFDLAKAPEIGVVTNVTPNHVDEYAGGFAEYAQGKFRLLAKQNSKQFAVLNGENKITKGFAKKCPGTPLFFATQQAIDNGAGIKDGQIVYSTGGKTTRVLPIEKLKLLGQHNLSNVLAATLTTRRSGVDWATIRRVLQSFRGLPQRLEVVAARQGVRFVNDTASTTPDSTIAALQSFPKNTVHWIGGGDPKGTDYDELVRTLAKQKPRSIVLMQSPAAEQISELLRAKHIPFELVVDLKSALEASTKNAQAGETVLLSPAAAYFCYFAGRIPLGGRGLETFIRYLKFGVTSPRPKARIEAV